MSGQMFVDVSGTQKRVAGTDLGSGTAGMQVTAGERLPTDAGVGAYVDLVTPSDIVDIPNGPPRALLVTAAGNVALQCLQSDATTRIDLPILPVDVWQVIPFGVYRVLATGTTATVYALW